MPTPAGVRNLKGVLSGGTFVGAGSGGTDVPPPTDTAPPPMPSVAKDGTWSLQWSQDFDIACAAGQILTTYGGAPAANDIGKGQFSAYTYGTTYKGGYTDTRSKHTVTIASVTTHNGTAVINSSAGFTFITIQAGAYVEGTGIPTETRIVSVDSTSQLTLNKNCTASGTITLVIRSDFGYYDQNIFSVGNDSICKMRIYTDAAGRHHVGALRPKLNNTASTWNVLGGRFAICIRVKNPLPTYKVAQLMWPQSNVSNPDGELDLPEQDLDGLDVISAFEHWQGAGGQSSASSTIDLVGAGWVVVVSEWRPNPGTPTLSTWKTYAAQYDATPSIIAGSLTSPFGSFTGVHVPDTPMHWIWQWETFLNYGAVLDSSVDQFVEFAWATFENPI